MTRLVTVLLAMVMLTGCGYVHAKGGKSSIPEPYRSQIFKLRERNVELEKQQEEIQRQSNTLSVEYNFNQQRMKTLATAAGQSLGITVTAFNVDTLEVEGK